MPTEIGTRVTSGNALDTAYDTSLIAGGRPVGWPETCFRYTIGAAPANGGTLYFETEQNVADPLLATPSTLGYVMEADIIMEDAPSNNSEATSLAVQKANGDGDFGGDPGHPLCTRLYYYRSALNDDKFQFLIDEGVDEVVVTWPSSGSISFGRSYRHRTIYDIKNQVIEWWIDGVLIHSMTLTASQEQNICTKVHGSSGSSGLRDHSWLVNWRYWGEIRSFPAKPLRPRIFGPGLAR